MSDLAQHTEWLSLIDISGPFLAEPVLKDAFPQGLKSSIRKSEGRSDRPMTNGAKRSIWPTRTFRGFIRPGSTSY